MHVGEGTFYRNLVDLFAPLRMPLFTFLSGFVYAYFPVMTGRVAPFATKKLRRLGPPLLTLTTIYYLLTFVAGDVNGKVPLGEAWRIYVFPYVHLWFLQAIALIFAALVVLERVGALATFRRFAATLVCAMAAGATIGGLAYESLFSYENAIYLLPFFLLGLGANRFREVLLRPAVAWACAIRFRDSCGFSLELGPRSWRRHAHAHCLGHRLQRGDGSDLLYAALEAPRAARCLLVHDLSVPSLCGGAVAQDSAGLGRRSWGSLVWLRVWRRASSRRSCSSMWHYMSQSPACCYWARVGIPRRGQEFRCRRRRQRTRARDRRARAATPAGGRCPLGRTGGSARNPDVLRTMNA